MKAMDWIIIYFLGCGIGMVLVSIFAPTSEGDNF